MHISHIIASYGTGGMESHIIALCNALSARHKVSVLVPPRFNAKFSERVQVIPMKGLLGSRFSLTTRFSILKQLKLLHPDIVHAHGGKAAQLITAPILFKRFKRVATVHGLKKRTGFLKQFDRIIAVSQTVADSLPGLPVDVVLNGIPSNTPPLPPPGNRPPVVLAVGRLAEVKGFDILLRAWEKVKDAHLVIAGDGPERNKLESLIQQFDLCARVKLPGFRDDIPASLSKADLLVIPSRREGASLVFIEALYAKRPVISTPVGMMPEFLPPGTMIPPENPAALAEKINEALADLPGFSRQFEPLWEFAHKELTAEAMAAKTEAVYEKILSGKS